MVMKKNRKKNKKEKEEEEKERKIRFNIFQRLYCFKRYVQKNDINICRVFKIYYIKN